MGKRRVPLNILALRFLKGYTTR